MNKLKVMSLYDVKSTSPYGSKFYKADDVDAILAEQLPRWVSEITFNIEYAVTFIERNGKPIFLINGGKLYSLKNGESNGLNAADLRAIASKLDELNKESGHV